MHGSATTCLLGLRVRIPPGAWMLVFCECCVLSGKVLCIGPITRPEEYYRLLCVWVWLWILDNVEAVAHWGSCATVKRRKKDLIFIRSSRFLSFIFQPTVYHGHVLLPLLLGSERLIWSVAHVNAIWNMSKRAWVHEFAWLNTPATRCDYSGN
jgi:hypothetical protein